MQRGGLAGDVSQSEYWTSFSQENHASVSNCTWRRNPKFSQSTRQAAGFAKHISMADAHIAAGWEKVQDGHVSATILVGDQMRLLSDVPAVRLSRWEA